MNGIGYRIRKAREDSGITQEQLAEYVGVSRTAVSKWEKGESEPSLTHLCALSGILCVSTDSLLGVPSEAGTDLFRSEKTVDALERFIEAILRYETGKEDIDERLDCSKM